MDQNWGAQPDPWRPPPARRSRRGWIIGGIAAVVVLLCLCVVSVALAPLALGALGGRLNLPGVTQAEQAVCPGAVARDVAPVDATGQFTVQPVYSEVLSYAKDAQGQSATQRADTWAKDVLAPYPPMDDIFTEAVGGVDKWSAELGSIDPSTFRCLTLDMQSADVNGLALKALQSAAKQVPGPHTLVYLVPWISHTFGGASQEQSLLIPMWETQPLDRLLPRDPSDWSFMYFPLYHEYLEVARYDRLGSVGNAYLTLLDNMVTDGMADNFAAHMTGGGLQYFGISSDQEARLWAQFKTNMNDYANPNEQAEMLGDPANGIPNAAGYQIGDHIVQGYIQRHPNVTFDQMASMDANTIYAGSGYDG